MSKKTNDNIKSQLAVVSDKPKIAGLAIALQQQQGEITKALPKGMDVERFTRIALTTVRTSKDLTRIAQNNPLSIIAGCMLSAQLGLELGPLGQAYLVPFKSKNGPEEAQFILGYKGILKLAYNSATVRDIQVRAVMPADYFEHEYGLHETLIHRPDWNDQSGDPVLFYGIARFANGGSYSRVVTLNEINEHRQRSQSQGSSYSPWNTDLRSMQMKTVVRIMQHWLPLSPESERGILADGAVSTAISPNMAEDATDFIDLEGDEVSSEVVEEPEAPEAPDGDPGRRFE